MSSKSTKPLARASGLYQLNLPIMKQSSLSYRELWALVVVTLLSSASIGTVIAFSIMY